MTQPGEGGPNQPSGWQPPYGQQPPPYGQQPPAYGQPTYQPYGGYGYPAAPAPPPGSVYGYPYPPAPVPGGRLASMGARFGGLVLDTIIIAVPSIILTAVFGGFHTTTSCDNVGSTSSCSTFSISGTLVPDLISLAIGIVYSAVLVGLYGQTLGHRAAGIKVVDAGTGALIGPLRAGVRWLVLGLTGSLCTLGYWSPFFDSTRRQGWHDKASNAVVIPAR